MCPDTSKSTTGVVTYLGNTTITWKVRKQKSTALSSTEAEYMAMTEASKEIMYLKSVLNSIGIQQPESINLFVDNKGAIDLSRNPAYHDRSKHIKRLYHFIRDQIADKSLTVHHVDGEDNVADIMTKPLGNVKQQYYCKQLGLFNQSVDSHSGSVRISVSST